MIHIEFTMTPKIYRQTCLRAIGAYYMRLYVVTLLIGTLLINLIALLTGNSSIQRISINLLISFIPMLVLCVLLSLFMAYLEFRRVRKQEPGVISGEMKARFEKKFMILQINGQNNKIHYNPYRMFKSGHNGFLLYWPQHAHIAIPGGLLTKEQVKEIKRFIREV